MYRIVNVLFLKGKRNVSNREQPFLQRKTKCIESGTYFSSKENGTYRIVNGLFFKGKRNVSNREQTFLKRKTECIES